MNSRKLILISAFAFLILLLLASVIDSIKNHNKQSLNVTTEQSPLTIKNSSALSSILLNKQYNAVYYDLSLFIQQRISPNARAATISNVGIKPDGSVKFNVTVGTQPPSSFEVSLDRSQFNKIGLSIPKYNYQKSLDVY
jgi:hypothetical protein